MVWDATSVLRLVERRGTVTGELFLTWYPLADSTGRLQTPWWRENCPERRELRQEQGWCRMPAWHISWPAVADTIRKLGAWNLLAHGDLSYGNHRITDQDAVFVEGIRGGRYGSVHSYPAVTGDSATAVLGPLADLVRQLTRRR
jgi:hypothetical protein